ncbi:Dipeptidyl peptidase 2 [Tetrabaena socialis]|uniref:Dipeptidyl peptidase 2 n=1 Tax=Tetrabaena socialis TaxID=47790 RepID=A0A2J8ACD2_9CHLO|nr:Dipeptidyl peptidase 2 [Tetrabaena socialis]|eukprot:PNH10179.1 Dipeptidyl peptidase 2 [Tetrabaena socialis]
MFPLAQPLVYHPAALPPLQALRDAAGVLYNVSGSLHCYTAQTSGPAAGNTGPWDYQWCTELMGQELPYYPANGGTDMFWDQGAFDLDSVKEHCREAWGVVPRPEWSATTYGGTDYRYASNIVFSNGLYDPWSAFGVLSNASDSVVAVIIPEGAHHLDLMFSHPADPGCVRAARATEMRHVRRWVQEHEEKRQQQQQREQQREQRRQEQREEQQREQQRAGGRAGAAGGRKAGGGGGSGGVAAEVEATA